MQFVTNGPRQFNRYQLIRCIEAWSSRPHFACILTPTTKNANTSCPLFMAVTLAFGSIYTCASPSSYNVDVRYALSMYIVRIESRLKTQQSCWCASVGMQPAWQNAFTNRDHKSWHTLYLMSPGLGLCISGYKLDSTNIQYVVERTKHVRRRALGMLLSA